MRFILSIAIDGRAFEYPATEITRILRQLADDIENDGAAMLDPHKLQDGERQYRGYG